MNVLVDNYNGTIVGPDAAKGILNKFMSVLESAGFVQTANLSGAVSGVAVPAITNNRVPTFTYDYTKNETQELYEFEYSIPSFDSDKRLMLRVYQIFLSDLNQAVLIIAISTRSVNFNSESTKMYIPLADVKSPASSLYKIRFSATGFGGFSIYISVDYVPLKRAIFGEPVYGLASATSDGYSISSIGQNPQTMRFYTNYAFRYPGDSSSGYGFYFTRYVAAKIGDSINQAGETASLANTRYVSIIGNDGAIFSGTMVAMSGIDGTGVKLFYTGSQGEKIFIPNGPMLATNRFLSQRLRMVLLTASNVAAVGELVEVLEPTTDGTEKYSYSMFDFDGQTDAEDQSYYIGLL